jgi:hypothetical protein
MPSTVQIVVPAQIDPQPVSVALRRHFDEELAQIPTGKSGRLSGALTTSGVGIGIGFRRGPFTLSTWGGREWSSGWLAGVGGSYVF